MNGTSQPFNTGPVPFSAPVFRTLSILPISDLSRFRLPPIDPTQLHQPSGSTFPIPSPTAEVPNPYLSTYGDYVFYYGQSNNPYFYMRPYALTFDYALQGTDAWTFTIREKKTAYYIAHRSLAKQQPIHRGGCLAVSYRTCQTTISRRAPILANQKPIAASGAALGADATDLCWGKLATNPAMKRVVLTDAPGFLVTSGVPRAAKRSMS